MIFRPELALKVLEGTKTETRRLVKPGDMAERRDSGQIAVVRHGRRVRFRLGLVAIQPGRGQRGIGWARVREIGQEHLGDGLTEAAAQREGCASRGDFARLWDEINKGTGTRWADNPLVWVLALEGSEQWGL